MQNKRNARERILEGSRLLFFKQGIRRVTVDEIAFNLGISKKTIYKNFKSKKEIVEKIFEEFKINTTNDINRILDQNDLSYTEKLRKVMSSIGIKLGGITSTFFEDIQLNYPELWRRINRYKQEAAFMQFNKLIDEGKKRGHIKKEVNISLVVALYASALENLLDPSFIRKLPKEIQHSLPTYPAGIFDNAMKIIYEGILTEETIQFLKKD